MIDWSKEQVVIIGAARQGLALADYLLGHGAQVTITDLQPLNKLEAAQRSLSNHAGSERLKWVCGEHPLWILDRASMVCPSGGVPLDSHLIQEAQRRQILLSNDSQIFLEAAPCLVIGITGSAGKTTTTTLVGRIARISVSGTDRKAWVGGNIGSPLIAEVDKMQPTDLAVMELSSFQLEIMTRSPQISALLNITPNHLDRHGTMSAYISAKSNILLHQLEEDTAVLNRDDPETWSLADKTVGRLISFGFSDLQPGQEGVYLRDGHVFLRKADRHEGANPASMNNVMLFDEPVVARADIALRGDHNLQNVMAACAISAAADFPIDAMRAGIKGFMGVPHRLEFVRTYHGADWYNDSIATAPERAIAAIRSFNEPLIVLAGGRDKNLPWQDFVNLVRQRVDHLILFGEAADLIFKALNLAANDRLSVSLVKHLQDAVVEASTLAEAGDVVLLSPGGTSFDEFKDFEERGECFARWVRELT